MISLSKILPSVNLKIAPVSNGIFFGIDRAETFSGILAVTGQPGQRAGEEIPQTVHQVDFRAGENLFTFRQLASGKLDRKTLLKIINDYNSNIIKSNRTRIYSSFIFMWNEKSSS